MEDLASSMGKVLPTAADLHIPLDQVGAAVAALTSAGVPAARATTALNQTMLQLVHPSKAAQTAMQEVGLTSTQVGDVLTHQGLQQALQLITDSIGKKFPQGSAQYMQALATIGGGTKSLGGILGTTGTNMQTFLGNMKNIGDTTQGAGNKVIGWNNVQKDFNQQLSQFKEVLQVAAERIGAVLIPALTTMVKIFTALMSNKLGLVAVGTAITFIGLALVKYFTSSMIGSIAGVGKSLLGVGTEAATAATEVGVGGGATGLVGALGALGPAGIAAGLALGGVTWFTATHWQGIKNVIDGIGGSITNILGGSSGPTGPTNLTPKQSQAQASAAAPGVKAEQKDQTGLLKTLATQTDALAKAKQTLANSTDAYNRAAEKEMADYAKYGPNSKQVNNDLAAMAKLSGQQADAQNKVNDAQSKVAATTKLLDSNTASLSKSQGGLLELINQLPAVHKAVGKAQGAQSDATINVNNKQKDLSTSFILFHGTVGPGAVDAHNRIQGAAKNLSGANIDLNNKTKDVSKAHQDQAQAMQTARYWADQHDQKIKALGLDSKTTKGYIDDLNNSLNNTNAKASSGGFWSKLFSHFAGGVTNFGGGLAIVGEQGPELVNLPPGSDVIPNGRTQQILNNTTAASNTPQGTSSNSQSITINGGVTIQAPNNSTFQSIMKSLNQDSLNVSKGLTPVGGAI